MSKYSTKVRQIINFGALYFKKDLRIKDGKLKIPKFHIDIIDALAENKYVNITGFRGCAKSTWAALIYPIHQIIVEFEPYTIIGRETDDLAREAYDTYLAKLLEIEETNEIVVKKAGEMTLSVLHTKENKKSKIRFVTRRKKIRGSKSEDAERPTLEVMDDVESYDTVDSKAERERTKKFVHGEALKGMSPERCQFINVGNYIHQDSLVANFERDERFVTIKIPALVDDKSSWEEVYPTETLKAEYEAYKANNMGNMWLMEMQCVIVDEENAAFKRVDFRYCEPDEAKKESILRFTVCDLAQTENQRSDYTAYVTCGIGDDDTIYVTDIVAGQWSAKTDKQARALYETYEKNQPMRIKVEAKAGSDGLFFALDTVAKEKGYVLPVDEVQASNEKDAKYKRIMSLQPLFLAGKIVFVKNLPFLSELENQLTTFPRSKHDDIIDALAYIQYCIFKKSFKKGIEKNIKKRPW